MGRVGRTAPELLGLLAVLAGAMGGAPETGGELPAGWKEAAGNVIEFPKVPELSHLVILADPWS